MNEIARLQQTIKIQERQIRELRTRANKISTGRHVRGAHIYGPGQKYSAATADPAYQDGFALVYFFSSGGVDELRVRGKIGATETQATIVDLSP